MTCKEAIDKEITLVNNLIGAAVIHGGDPGGPYYCFPSRIQKRMQEYLLYKKLEDRYDIDLNAEYDDGDYSCSAPQFVPKGETYFESKEV